MEYPWIIYFFCLKEKQLLSQLHEYRLKQFLQISQGRAFACFYEYGQLLGFEFQYNLVIKNVEPSLLVYKLLKVMYR